MNEKAIHGAPKRGKEWRIALSNHYAWYGISNCSFLEYSFSDFDLGSKVTIAKQFIHKIIYFKKCNQKSKLVLLTIFDSRELYKDASLFKSV